MGITFHMLLVITLKCGGVTHGNARADFWAFLRVRSLFGCLYVNSKWTAFIERFLRAMTNQSESKLLPHIHPFIHTSILRRRVGHARRPPAGREQLGVRCLAPGTPQHLARSSQGIELATFPITRQPALPPLCNFDDTFILVHHKTSQSQPLLLL